MRKTLTILSLLLAAFFVAPGAASAYGPTEDATVSDTNPDPGEPFTFSAAGFQPGSEVTITVNTDDATVAPASVTAQTVTADSTGVASASITIDVEGTYTITASGIGADGQPLTVSETVVVGDGTAGSGVVSDGAAGSGVVSDDGEALPRTGADGIAGQLWAGVGLLGLGAGLVALTVSRRRASTTA